MRGVKDKSIWISGGMKDLCIYPGDWFLKQVKKKGTQEVLEKKEKINQTHYKLVKKV
jgi:hypothetical protein